MAVAATGIPAESGEPAMDKPRMKGRHLVMMSLGSAIGTGLFVGSGKGVAAAGPATLVAYIVAGLLVIAIMYMLGEMVAAHGSGCVDRKRPGVGMGCNHFAEHVHDGDDE